MTPTEKKYLLFLSPRTPRPKSIDRPSIPVLRRMITAGWIQPSRHTGRFADPYHCIITDLGERALDALNAPRSDVTWHPMNTAPLDQTLLFTDGERVRAGVFDGDAVHAGVATPQSHWTHWAAFPSPPREKRDA